RHKIPKTLAGGSGNSAATRSRGLEMPPARSERAPLPFLDHLSVDHLDVQSDAIPILSQRVFGHPTLVRRRQLISHALLHLLERGAVGRRLLHGGDEIREIPAEEGQMVLGGPPRRGRGS